MAVVDLSAIQIERVCEDTVLLSIEKSDDSAQRLAAICDYLLDCFAASIIEIVPSYQSILLRYDCLQLVFSQLATAIDGFKMPPLAQLNTTLHRIPVYYHADVAADLDSVCVSQGLDYDALVALHTQTRYSVYALGFMPGFAYLGFLEEQLCVARHATVRQQVPAGSVALANNQTAVYPFASPGGWQVIGRTPVAVYADGKSIFSAGDRVQFESIDRQTYLDLGGIIE